jgi:coenzyme F420-0:L-glutamate ligase / coenzyme F420-1:gamma-L-glutamate ligase
MPVIISGVAGLPEIEPGTDIASSIMDLAEVADGDIVVVTSKIVSKAEGRTVELDTVTPSEFAEHWSVAWNKDPRVVEIVLRESKRIVRQVGPVLITETHHGFVCANSGVDQSSSGASGRVVLLPLDPDGSARVLRARFAELGVDVAVIISDTFGRAWREGQTDVAIGVAGLVPLTSYIGQVDPHGHEFRVQELCVADELAGAAEPDDLASIQPVIRESSRDLFR